MKTELKKLYIDVQENNSKVILCWYGQELTISCQHIEIKNLETEEKMPTKKNYTAFYNHTIKKIDVLLDLLNIDLFKAWEIFKNQESFAEVENWEDWENVETIDDLNLEINKYDSTKEALEKYEINPLNNDMIN